MNLLDQIYPQEPSCQTAVDPEVLLNLFPDAYKILQQHYGVEEEPAPTVEDGLEPTLKDDLESTADSLELPQRVP